MMYVANFSHDEETMDPVQRIFVCPLMSKFLSPQLTCLFHFFMYVRWNTRKIYIYSHISQNKDHRISKSCVINPEPIDRSKIFTIISSKLARIVSNKFTQSQNTKSSLIHLPAPRIHDRLFNRPLPPLPPKW